MSFPYMCAVRGVRNLTATEQHLMYYLADRANEFGWCFPGQDTIATDTFQSETTVRRTLRALEQKGLIQRTRRSTRYGRTSDEIQLLIEPLERSKAA